MVFDRGEKCQMHLQSPEVLKDTTFILDKTRKYLALATLNRDLALTI